jgi:hypothetical protein
MKLLRTCRLSNVGLDLLVERTQADLAATNARVASLENAAADSDIQIANEANARILAEGFAIDFHSQLLIADFNRIHLQSQNNELQHSVQQLTNSSNQIVTENQTLISLVDETKSQLLFTKEKATADAKISATKIAELQSQLKKLEDNRISDIARANSNTLSLTKQISILREKVAQMVPISDIRDSHHQTQKWKQTFEEEKQKYLDLQQAVGTQIENAQTTTGHSSPRLFPRQ